MPRSSRFPGAEPADLKGYMTLEDIMPKLDGTPWHQQHQLGREPKTREPRQQSQQS